MTDKEILQSVLQSKPISYRADFAKICGSVAAGVMLSQAYYWSGRSTKHGEGWFEKTSAEWDFETGLTDKQQQTARHTLAKLGFMVSERKGDRGRMCSRLNIDEIYKALVAFYKADRRKGESDQIGKRENLHRQKGESKIGKKANLSLQRIHTESTTEKGAPGIESTQPALPKSEKQKIQSMVDDLLSGEVLDEGWEKWEKELSILLAQQGCSFSARQTQRLNQKNVNSAVKMDTSPSGRMVA